MTQKETVFAVESNTVKYGPGVLKDLGAEALDLGMRRVALFTDRNLARLEALETARESLKAAGLSVEVYAETRVEPTDLSFLAAARFAIEGEFDGYVSLGGGSVMDTAKAANLLATHRGDLLDYVALPYGAAKPVPGPLKPHIACPTTSGTGSECTGIAVFDFQGKNIKTVIAHKRLRPSLALVDPTTTYSLPGGVVASTGFDILTHAIESYTARPFSERDKPAKPNLRPMSQGGNPWSDMGALEAIRIGGRYLERAVADAGDREARDKVMFAATLAGIAFGNSGVHIPHAMSYAVAGLSHKYVHPGYESIDPVVPHGISVVLNAPAAFRWTSSAQPERHLAAAEALGADTRNAHPRDAGELLASRLAALMKSTGVPNGISAVGYSEADIPALAKGTHTQQRLLVNAPRLAAEADLQDIFKAALRYW